MEDWLCQMSYPHKIKTLLIYLLEVENMHNTCTGFYPIFHTLNGHKTIFVNRIQICIFFFFGVCLLQDFCGNNIYNL